jgi:hypothetical protein
MSASDRDLTRRQQRRPGLFPVVTVVLLILAAVLVLARVVPGPRRPQVTVVETGRVGTSKDGNVPPPE